MEDCVPIWTRREESLLAQEPGPLARISIFSPQYLSLEMAHAGTAFGRSIWLQRKQLLHDVSNRECESLQRLFPDRASNDERAQQNRVWSAELELRF
jgi:hypothetical protein